MTRSGALVLSAFVAMTCPHPPAALAQSAAQTSQRFMRDQNECARHEEATPTWCAEGRYLGLVCKTIYSGG